VIESAPLRFCALRLCARDLDREALARFARLPFELLRLEFELDRFALLLGLEPVAFRRVSVRLFELFVLVDCAISLLGSWCSQLRFAPLVFFLDLLFVELPDAFFLLVRLVAPEDVDLRRSASPWISDTGISS
jgi:hypothetical protein